MKFQGFFFFAFCLVTLLFKQSDFPAFHKEKWLNFLSHQEKKGKILSSHYAHRITWDTLLTQEKKQSPALGVTYELSGGRLGDNLLSFFHAKWLAYKYQIPFFFTPFPNADVFALSTETKPFPFTEQKVVLQRERDLAELNSFVVVPYFGEPSMKNQKIPFAVDWSDAGFRAEIARSLQPTRSVQTLSLPKDRITVGIHVRRGGTFDGPAVQREYPLKFPPDAYYLEQIRTIAQIFKGKPLYVFLLTDDLHREELLERYKKAIPDPQIEWGCRPNSEVAADHIIDDFFSIPLFDCLVLCDSNFSIVASKLKDYAVKITPTHYRKKKGSVEISQVELELNPYYEK